MSLSTNDANAIIGLANRMGVDPGSLAGLMHMESGIDPNIWGGAGGNYRGLIQFGPGARQEVGLPDGPMTISAQIPYVEEYFRQRGFKPGMSAEQMYRTVLVGNPHQSGTDSWGTNSDKAGARMRPGGDLYNAGMSALKNATAKADFMGTGASDSTTALPSEGFGGDSNGTGFDLPPAAAAAKAALGVDMAKVLSDSAAGRMAGAQVPGLFEGAQRELGDSETGMAGQSLPSVFSQMSKPAGQSGSQGPIEYLTGDPDHAGYRDDHAGSNYHEHLAFATKEQRDAAMAKLRAHGIEIGSINDSKHAPGSYHYQDLAFDVPAHQVPVGQEQALSRRVRAILGF